MFAPLLKAAIAQRQVCCAPPHQHAFRLFSGFYEGLPELLLDVYGETLVIYDYAINSAEPPLAVLEVVLAELPWLKSAIWKRKKSSVIEERTGQLLFGSDATVARRVVENGVRYAIIPRTHQEAGLYLDTREVRTWAKASLAGKRVLNTFAYTGSLGVAARAAGATVLHTDQNRTFLNVAKDSYALNGFAPKRGDFRVGNFFEVAAELKRQGALFDCVFLDPPFFSSSEQGRIDLETGTERLINKVRPLVADDGLIVAINNALYTSGKDYLASLEAITASGYATLEQLLPVPEDVTGYAATRQTTSPVDPAPFNHSTKIAVLRLKRKDGKRVATSE